MTAQSPNDFDLFHLKENYVNHIIDGMDVDCLVQVVHDLLMDEYEKLTWDEVTEEIVDLYDEDTLIDLIPESEWYIRSCNLTPRYQQMTNFYPGFYYVNWGNVSRNV